MLKRDIAPRYCSYLLRCWQERGDEAHPLRHWRFSLEDPHTGQRHGFTSMKAMVSWLENELATAQTVSEAGQMASNDT